MEFTVINQAVDLAGLFIGIGMMVILIAIASIIMKLMRLFKSFEYRKYLVDMFVSSKLRQLAKKDGLNLVEEENSYAKWRQKNKIKEIKEVDSKIVEKVNKEIDDSMKKSKPKKESTKKSKTKKR